MNTPGFRALLLILVAIAGVTAAGCSHVGDGPMRPIRQFRLRFQYDDFTVPTGETWQLRWSSPYKPWEITPAYDVRIEHGQAWIGKQKTVLARGYDYRPGETGLLDLSANTTGGTAIVWLESGTLFCTANDLIEITVRVFPEETPVP